MNGKLKILLALIFFVNFAFGKVSVEVDKKNVIQGDSLTIIVKAQGKNITFPNISKIGNYQIESVGSSQQFQSVNGVVKREKSKFYTITPSKSFTIPSFTIKVDGKVETTKPIKINVLKDTKFQNSFKLEIETPKKIYQHYANLIKVKFLQKTSEKISALSMIMPKGNFTLKPIGKEKEYYSGIYKVYELTYELIPENSGNIDLTTSIKIGKNEVVDNYGFIQRSVKYKTLTTPKKVRVLPMPMNIIGNYKISLTTDKKIVNSNTPVNATLDIEGYGDLSNLDNIKINIPNTTIYDEKPIIHKKIKDNKIYSTYTKKYVILANSDYIIPKLKFSFYSNKKDKKETIFTKEIKIKVHSSLQNQIPNKNEIVKTEIKYKNNYLLMIIIFLAGVIVGFILNIVLKRVKKDKFIMPKNLYKRLLPYANDKAISNILYKLEKKEKLSKEEKDYIDKKLRDLH